MLNFAIETAREAGKILADFYARGVTIEHKGAIDLVTVADVTAERRIIELIEAAHPDHTILAEESGKRERPSDYKWIIDPLDGTTNFAHGYPCFCVSIALERAGEIVVGVIYNPISGELFAAEKGAGATLNDKPIRVSEVAELEQGLLVTGFPYSVEGRRIASQRFIKFIMHSQGVRRDGSAAMDLASVACGRFDGFWEDGLNPWDVAAGVLLVREAGGRVTRFDDSLVDIYSPPLLASNGLIHVAMMNVLTGAA